MKGPAGFLKYFFQDFKLSKQGENPDFASSTLEETSRLCNICVKVSFTARGESCLGVLICLRYL